MTEQKIVESRQVVPESQETPTPAPSGQTDASQTSQAAQDVPQFVTKADLEDFRKSLQSRKDKGISNLEKQVTQLSEQISQYEAYRATGLTPEQAQREMQVDALLAQQVANTEVPATEPQGSGDEWGAALDSIFTKTGLDKNDPKVLELAQKYGDSPAFLGELTALGIERASQPPPSPGTIVTPSGGLTPSGDFGNMSDDEIGAKLEDLFLSPTKNKVEIEQLGAELERRVPQQKI